MPPRRFSLALFSVLVAASGPAMAANKVSPQPLPRATPAEVGMDAVGLQKVDDKLREFVARKQVAGGVVLVARHGKVVHLSAIGKADIATARPIQPDTIFGLASMTKSLTGTALMILVDEGKVQLDVELSTYLPAFKEMRLRGGKKPARQIIVRDCLRHTSGLENKSTEGNSLAEIVDGLAKTELMFDPGSQILYGPGQHVCARIVEVVSGKSFEEFSAERIFKPLGMVDTTYRPNPEQQKRAAKIYKPSADGKDLVPGEHNLLDFSTVKTRVPNPSGGIFSSVPDLARFFLMIRNGGELQGTRILSAKTIKEMGTLQTSGLTIGTFPGRGWGLAFRYISDPNGGENIKKLARGTFGHGGAFGTEGWIDPVHDTIFIMLIQRQNFSDKTTDGIREALQGQVIDSIRD